MIVTLEVAGTTPMNAYVAMPKGEGKFPAVMVFQEAFGVNQHIREITDRVAELGYVAIAPELFHRQAPAGFEVGYNEFQKIMPIMQTLTPETLLEDVTVTYNWLKANPSVAADKIGCIGFCLGGRVALLTNSALPVKAATSFYGGGAHTMADRVPSLHAPMLFFWGGKDQHIKREHIQTLNDALDAAGKPYICSVISYADHGFNCDARASYHPEASKEAWAMSVTFLKNKLA